MKGSKQSRRDAKQLFQSCQVDGALDEARVRQAVALLIEKCLDLLADCFVAWLIHEWINWFFFFFID